MTAPSVGDILRITNLNISGYPKPSIKYQWLRNETSILGASGETYGVVFDDLGYTLGVEITLQNLYGITSAIVNLDGVASIEPSFNTLPTASETNPFVGTTVFIQGVSVSGIPTPTITYDWYLDGITIEGQTGSSYTTAATGDLISTVTAINVGGITSATVDFGTVIVISESPDWDTYRDGIYRFPTILNNQPRFVTVLDTSSDLPAVASVFLE